MWKAALVLATSAACAAAFTVPPSISRSRLHVLKTAVRPPAESTASLVTASPIRASPISARSARVARLRELGWWTAVRNDLTEAEFVVQLDEAARARENLYGGSAAGESGGGEKRRDIDYTRLASRLADDLRGLEWRDASGASPVLTREQVGDLLERLYRVQDALQYGEAYRRQAADDAAAAADGGGGGAAAAAADGGDAAAGGGDDDDGGGGQAAKLRAAFDRKLSDQLRAAVPPDVASSLENTADAISEGYEQLEMPVFVRDDGTVDWDAALETGREAASYGTALWERLNGVADSHGGEGAEGAAEEGQAREASAEELAREGRVVAAAAAAEAELAAAEAKLASLRDAAPAVPARTLALADREVTLLGTSLELRTLDLDMERISLYLEREIERADEALPEASSGDLKYLIAEFGLLDAQLQLMLAVESDAAANAAAAPAFAAAAAAEEFDASRQFNPAVVAVDPDELKVVAAEVTELQQRLGLTPESEEPFAVNWSQLQLQATQLVDKSKTGFEFYARGTKLLGDDVLYGASLFGRALQGSTLTPREVRTLRRTGKDVATFIPFLIILIAPLTPVGHVLVFSFIQRIFPGFFPTTFTERRQNLMRMYDQVAPAEER